MMTGADRDIILQALSLLENVDEEDHACTDPICRNSLYLCIVQPFLQCRNIGFHLGLPDCLPLHIKIFRIMI